MQSTRDVLRTTLAASLKELEPLDRMAAAWPVVAGRAIAERSSITAYDEGTVTVLAETQAWRRQLLIMHDQLRSDLQRVSRVPVTDILFVLPTPAPVLTGPEQGTRKRP